VKDLLRKTALVLALVVVLGGAADAQNLTTNGEFESNVTGWHLVGRGALAHSGTGYSSSGSLQVSGGLAGGKTQAIAGQCIPSVAPSQNHQFRAQVQVVTGSPEHCRIALFESERSDCRWIELGGEGPRSSPPSTGWFGIGNVMTTAATTRSVEVRLHCANPDGDTGALEVLFDAVVVEPGGFVEWIFGDGFETNNTSAWSATVQ
jgi:hypothetical protein